MSYTRDPFHDGLPIMHEKKIWGIVSKFSEHRTNDL